MLRAATASVRSASRAAGLARRWKTYFTKEHEYVKVDGRTATCGITDFAQSQLGDVVFVGLPKVNASFKQG